MPLPTDWLDVASEPDVDPSGIADSAAGFRRLRGALPKITWYLRPGTYRIESAVTFPSMVSLVFDVGAQLFYDIPNETSPDLADVTIEGEVQAGRYQIFAGSRYLAPPGLAGDFFTRQVGSPARNPTVPVEWWGATDRAPAEEPSRWHRLFQSSGRWRYGLITDNTVAIQACINAARPGQRIEFSGSYPITQLWLRPGLTYTGAGGVLTRPPAIDAPLNAADMDESELLAAVEEAAVAYDLHRAGSVIYIDPNSDGPRASGLHGGGPTGTTLVQDTANGLTEDDFTSDGPEPHRQVVVLSNVIARLAAHVENAVVHPVLTREASAREAAQSSALELGGALLRSPAVAELPTRGLSARPV